jgi:transposase InsO family protein/transposase-like protein
MANMFSVQFKQKLVKQYQTGKPMSCISQEYNIAKSTLYYWVGLYRSQTTSTGAIVTPRELDSAKRRIQKYEGIISVLKAVDCTASSPLRDKLKALEPLYGKYSVHTLCEALEIRRGTFYNHILRSKRENAWFIKRRQSLMSEIQKIFDDSRQIFGAGKVRAVLVRQGHNVSEKIVSELMREMGLYSIRITSKKDSRMLVKYEKKVNMLKQNFEAKAPNTVWASDITYYKFKNSHFYICVFIDLFSRKVLSLAIGKNGSTQLVKRAFKAACRSRKTETSFSHLIIHTDRGTSYTSYSMEDAIKKIGAAHSFSHAGKPHDNAVAESFFSTLKKEELYRARYSSETELKMSLEKYVSFFNAIRLHKYLNYQTPDQVENRFWNKSK